VLIRANWELDYWIIFGTGADDLTEVGFEEACMQKEAESGGNCKQNLGC